MRLTAECERCGASTLVMRGRYGGAVALEHTCDTAENRAMSGPRPKGPIYVTLLERGRLPGSWRAERGGAF